MKLLKIGILACALAGCATTNAPSMPGSNQSTQTKASTTSKKSSHEFVQQNVKFVEDEHIGARKAIAPDIKYLDPNRNKWSDGYIFYQIIGIDVGRSGPDVIDFSDVQIRMRQTTTGDLPFYSSAYSHGQKLGFTKVDSGVNCLSGTCYKKEVFGVDITLDQLRSASQSSDFSIKVIGKGNSAVIEIPQSYITGFLSAIDMKENQN